MTSSRTLFYLALSAAMLPAGGLTAQEYDRVPWRTPRVSLVVQQKPVRDLIKEFATSQNLPLSISDSVAGVVSGVFRNIESERFLNGLCEANDLMWFYDGVRLNVESADEIISRPLSLPYVTPAALGDVLYTVGYASGPPGRQVTVKNGHRPGLLLLVGGPQFIQATEALARDLDGQEQRRVNEQITVRAFRLNYASASDLTLNTGTSSSIVPGVARSLQNLMANQLPGSVMSTGPVETERPRSREGLRGAGLASIGTQRSNPLVPDRGQGQAQAGPGGQDRFTPPDPNDPRAPVITVDARLNAVLVRDVAARMPLYEELIKMLDVPTKAIEITAAIVDIDSDNGRQLGFEILGFGKNGNDIFRMGFDADRGQFDGVNTQGQIPSFNDGANLARGAGLNATALIGGAGYQLLSRLRAIEEIGAGQIVSSPSVLTMENVQAVIRTDEKVYVRVEGNMEVDLFDVTTGVQLRVTPTVVREGASSNYRLQIDIKDGGFVDQRVDDIPATRESAINTQAIVPENKTLLLGGYFVERRTRNARQVPLLSKVPGLGKLFSRNERNHERTQRFFFITPRLVDVSKEATSRDLYSNPEVNDLALPARLPESDMSRERAEDLARRLASGSFNEPWDENYRTNAKKPNPILPSLRDVPRAMMLEEGEPAPLPPEAAAEVAAPMAPAPPPDQPAAPDQPVAPRKSAPSYLRR